MSDEELEAWFNKTAKSYKTYNVNGTVNFHDDDGKIVMTAGSGFEKNVQ